MSSPATSPRLRRFRFSLRTLVILVLSAGTGINLWFHRAAWRQDHLTTADTEYVEVITHRLKESNRLLIECLPRYSDEVGRMEIWDPAQVRRLGVYDWPNPQGETNWRAHWLALPHTLKDEEGEWIGDGTRIVSTLTGETMVVLEAQVIDISGDGKTMLMQRPDWSFVLLNTDSWRQTVTFTETGDFFLGYISPDRSGVLGQNKQGMVQVWDGATGRSRWPAAVAIKRAGDYAYSPDGRRLAVMAAIGLRGILQMRIYDTQTGALVGQGPPKKGQVYRKPQFVLNGAAVLYAFQSVASDTVFIRDVQTAQHRQLPIARMLRVIDDRYVIGSRNRNGNLELVKIDLTNDSETILVVEAGDGFYVENPSDRLPEPNPFMVFHFTKKGFSSIRVVNLATNQVILAKDVAGHLEYWKFAPKRHLFYLCIDRAYTTVQRWNTKIGQLEATRDLRLTLSHYNPINLLGDGECVLIHYPKDDGTHMVLGGPRLSVLNKGAGAGGNMHRGGRIADQYVVSTKGGEVFLWNRLRPEYWWGFFCLKEFWALLVTSILLLWSLRRDWKSLPAGESTGETP